MQIGQCTFAPCSCQKYMSNADIEKLISKKEDLPDIQNTKPNYEIPINCVGIEELKLPIYILEKSQKHQQTIANITTTVDLAANLKGISMSRLLEVLHEYSLKAIQTNEVIKIAKEIQLRSHSNKCVLNIRFPYFIQKLSPVSRIPGFINYDVAFLYADGIIKYYIKVYVTSLCPCSKEISNNSAHNQKCGIEVFYTTNKWIWFEDVIEIVEKCGSSEIYSILKRPDEKVVTEQAYNNPMFVEDILRNVYNKLDNIDGIDSFIIKVSSEESIHMHNAIAMTKKGDI